MKEITDEQRMLATTECATWGHDLSPALVGTEPVGMVCKRCDRTWSLAGPEAETVLEPHRTFSATTPAGKPIEMVILQVTTDGRAFYVDAQDRASWELQRKLDVPF